MCVCVSSIKICDFGLAREKSFDNMTPHVVTQYYRAPELILGVSEYSSSIDLWSAGCILVELFTNGILFQVCSDNRLLVSISHLCLCRAITLSNSWIWSSISSVARKSSARTMMKWRKSVLTCGRNSLASLCACSCQGDRMWNSSNLSPRRSTWTRYIC